MTPSPYEILYFVPNDEVTLSSIYKSVNLCIAMLEIYHVLIKKCWKTLVHLILDKNLTTFCLILYRYKNYSVSLKTIEKCIIR